MKNKKFSRSNVSESMLLQTDVSRSGYDLSRSINITPLLGRFHPVNVDTLMPGEVVRGSMNAHLEFEKIATPSIGRIRLDTHNFVVSAHRINKDFRLFYEGQSGYTNLPNFNWYHLCGHIFACLTSLSNNVTEIGHASWFDVDNFQKTCDNCLAEVISNYSTWLALVPKNTYFTQDFMAEEISRIGQYRQTMAGNHVHWGQIVEVIMRPYVGLYSNMDFIGYPVYRQYSLPYELAKKYWSASKTTIQGAMAEFGKVTATEQFSFKGVTGTMYQHALWQFDEILLKCEMQLRAAYACWYDYFRDFKLEPRTSCLDPDSFANTSLFTYTNHDITEIKRDILLLVPRYRYYAKDLLTSVQRDDVYRWVYGPIFSAEHPLSRTVNTSTETMYNEIDTIADLTDVNLSTSVTFPVGIFDHTAATGNYQAYIHDLTTMRRAGMLEKYLARKFNNPDTFVGTVQAHYNIQPGDLGNFSSLYLGGSENYMDGNQEVNATTTSEAPAGTRTLVANAGTTDSFAFSAQDTYYLVSFVSMLPMVHYDAANQFLDEISRDEMPSPEYAQDTRTAIRTRNLLRGFDTDTSVLGYAPRYLAYRGALDRSCGKYLTDYRSYSFLRDWYNIQPFDYWTKPSSLPKNFTLSPYSLRVHLKPDAFLNNAEFSPVAYGAVEFKLSATSPLPAAVELI